MHESYRIFKLILDDDSKQYEERVGALLTTWEKIASLIQNCEDAVDNLFTENLHRDTLQLVLQGEWPKLSPIILTHLTVTLRRCVSSVNGSLREKVARLNHIVKEPWGHPTLQKILASDVANIKTVEAQEFCSSEGIMVLLVRLQVLCASKCEDIALKLSRLCFPYWRHNPRCPSEHWTHLRDTHVALLYKFKLISSIVEEVLQGMNFEDGAKMVQHHSSLPTSRLWKHPGKVAMLESCYFMSAALKQPSVSSSLEEVLHVWLELHRSSQTSTNALCELLRGLTIEVNSEQIDALCACLTKELGSDLQSFYIELYIRGLNFDLNSLGHHKLESDKEKVREIECRLSKSFLHLAELLSGSVTVSRECVLTAFSLYPSEETFARVQEFAPSNVENSANGEKVTDLSNYNELSIPDQLLDAASLGLSQQLCDDLLVVINNPRWHSLSWLLKWSELESLCKRYLQDPEGSRYIIKELNFLDIDYEQFKDLPAKQCSGIEEGYEYCLYPTRKRGRKRKSESPKAKPKPAKVVTKKPKEILLPVKSEPESLKDLLKSESLESKSELNLTTQIIPVPQPFAVTKQFPDSHLEVKKPVVTTIPVSQPFAATQLMRLKISNPHPEIENPKPTQTFSVSRPVVQRKRLKVSDSHNKMVPVKPQVSNSEVTIIKYTKKGSRSKCPSILKRSKSQSNKNVNSSTLQETDSVRSLRWLPVRASIAAAVNNQTSDETGETNDSAESLSCLSPTASVSDSTARETRVSTDDASIASIDNLTSYYPEMPTNDTESVNESTTTVVPTESVRLLRYLPVRASIAASIAQKTGIPIDKVKSLRYAPVNNSTSQAAEVPTDGTRTLKYLLSTASVDNSTSQATEVSTDSTRTLTYLLSTATVNNSTSQVTRVPTDHAKSLRYASVDHSTSHAAEVPTDSTGTLKYLLSTAPVDNSTSEATEVPNDSAKSLRWLPSRASNAASLLQNPKQQTMVFRRKLGPKRTKHISKQDKLFHLDSISPAITVFSSVYQKQATQQPTIFKLDSISPSYTQQQTSELQQPAEFKQESIPQTITTVASLYQMQQPNSSTIFKLDSISPSYTQHQTSELQQPTECKQESIPRTITVVPSLTQQQESYPVDLKQAIMSSIKSAIHQTECLNMASSSSEETTSVVPNLVTNVPNLIPTMQPATGVAIKLCDASERIYQGKNNTATSHSKIMESLGTKKIVPSKGNTITTTPHTQHCGSARTMLFAPSVTQSHKPSMADKRKTLPALFPMSKPPKLSAMTSPPKLIPIMVQKPVSIPSGYMIRQQTTGKSCSTKPPKLSAAIRLEPPKLKPMMDQKPRIAPKSAVHPKLQTKTNNNEKLTYGFCSDIRLSTSPDKSVTSKPAANQTKPKQPQNKLPTSSKRNYLLKPYAVQYKHASTETENNVNVVQSNNSKLLPSVQPVSRVYGFLSNAVKKPNILNEAQNQLNQTFVGKTSLPAQKTKVQQQQQTLQSKTFQCHYLRPNFPYKQSLNFKRQNDSESALINQTSDEQSREKHMSSIDFCEVQSDYNIKVVERKQNSITCTISDEINCNLVQNLKLNLANRLNEVKSSFEVQNHGSVSIKTTENIDFEHSPNNNCPVQIEQSSNQSPVKEEKLEIPNCTSTGEQLNDFMDQVKHETPEFKFETEVTEIINSEEINDLLTEFFPDPEPTEWSSELQ